MNNNFTTKSKVIFKTIFKNVVEDESCKKRESIDEAAFPAYAKSNIFIDNLFWGRLRIVERYIQSQNENQEKLCILDYGCGSGVMAYILGSHGYNVSMTDVDPIAFNYIKEEIQFPNNVRWIEIQFLDEKKYENIYDRIVVLDVLEHVDDLESFVKYFKRLLKPGGEIIVSGPTENIIYRIGRWIAGSRFTGHYHKTNINNIESIFGKTMNIKKIATLYPLFPFFKIFSASPKTVEDNGN